MYVHSCTYTHTKQHYTTYVVCMCESKRHGACVLGTAICYIHHHGALMNVRPSTEALQE